VPADIRAVDQAQFPWRPLGALLVERDLLSAAELDRALAEQRRSGRLLGQVLVRRGFLDPASLVRVLAEQHGVGLDVRSAPPTATSDERRQWRPLGRVLVEKGYLSGEELAQVLAEQHEHPERLLGEIIVSEAYVSGYELAQALAEQHGVELDADEEFEAVVEPAPSGQPVYRVYEVAYDPVYRPGEILYQSASFLVAAEFAGEYVQREQPSALEIDKVDGPVRETVWTFSEARASAKAASREQLVRTFGFDPVSWGTRRS
jgi:hypothetical protein